MGIFSKNILYEDFDHVKRFSFLIKHYGIKSTPYFEDRSIFRNLSKNGLKSDFVWNLLKESSDFRSFVLSLEKYILKKYRVKIWAEKTPENITMVKYFIAFFPEAKLIHIVRDARDVILSLMKRGLSMEQSAEVWLTSVASIQPYVEKENVLQIKFEDLVINPKGTLIKICEFLNVQFEQTMLKPNKAVDKKGLDTWEAQPFNPINKRMAYKYKRESVDFSPIFSMKLTSEFARLQQIEEFYLIDLLKTYCYEISEIEFKKYKSKPKLKVYPKVTKNFKLKLIDFIIEKHTPISRVEL